MAAPRNILSFILSIALPVLIAPAALAFERVVTEHAETTLIPAREGFAPGETTWFAFHQKLEEGWHVYWRNPGDSGLPLSLDWSLPAGFEAGEVLYPLPERLPIGPLANYGHKGEATFLVGVTAPANSAPGEIVEVGLNAAWLICEEICVPEEGVFSLRLPVSAAPAEYPPGARLLEAAKASQPEVWQGEAVFDTAPDEIVLEARGDLPDFREALYFPYADGLIEPAAAQKISRSPGRIAITMKPGYALDPDTVQSFGGVLVLTDKDGARRGFELRPERQRLIEGPRLAQGSSVNLPILLVIGFLGGLILNLMPCVFPVVFIKAAALVETARLHPDSLRRDGLLYMGGVIATFSALGGALLLARAGGERLGWGFHLQSPGVVLFSAYVLFLVGLNLAGVFHVGESVQRVSGSVTVTRKGLSAFLTGVLAVFIATPCIGPLMSAPLAAAILLPPAAGMAIFIALALGLAAPYVALSFVPALGRLLPRPGLWMAILKQALAFPVFAAAAFFLWVLAQQTGANGLGVGLAGALLLALAAWLFELGKREGRGALLARGLSALAVLAALFPLFSMKPQTQAPAAAPTYGELVATPFDPQAIEAMRAEGKPVFVDFTAAWCVTCQFNKLTILSTEKTARAFHETGTALMTADWTNRDPAITAALESFGATGVPLYVYYPPEGEPKVLALPLTERALLSALGSE